MSTTKQRALTLLHTPNLRVNDCTIDLTTASPIYNPMGAQGQWMFHRFGKRSYPELEIDIEVVLNLIESLPDLKTLRLHSVYGDPLKYTHIFQVLNLCKQRGIRVIATTYGHFYTDRLSGYDLDYNLKLAGIKGKAKDIYLHTNWDRVKVFMRDFDNVTVNFQTYQSNVDQVEELKRLCDIMNCKINQEIGSTYQDGVGHVIDERGVWIYDVHTGRDKTTSLVRTGAGYSLLKKYLKKQSSVNILDKECFIPSFSGEAPVDEESSSIFVSVTGHVFNSYNHFELFSNALCNDWSEGVAEYSTHEYGVQKRDEYIERTCDVLRYLHGKIDDIDLNKKNITDMLSCFNVTAARRDDMAA